MSVRKIQKSGITECHRRIAGGAQPMPLSSDQSEKPAGDGEVCKFPDNVAFIHCALFASAGFAFGSA
jgi:hypothetical protein